jgi:hypothetical protein
VFTVTTHHDDGEDVKIAKNLWFTLLAFAIFATFAVLAMIRVATLRPRGA